MSKENEGKNPITTWVVTNKDTIRIARTLLSHNFTKMEMSEKARKIYGEDAIRYFDDYGNEVIIDYGKKKGTFTVKITRGAKSIISDGFGGLDSFHKAEEDDL